MKVIENINMISNYNISKYPQNDRKRKTNDTKDEDLYIDCRFIFGIAACAERIFSHCKYIKTETRNRLTPQLLKLLLF